LCSLIAAGTASAQSADAPSEPIVPDSQFESELPSLDPALDQPLEPIAPMEPIDTVPPASLDAAPPAEPGVGPTSPAPPPDPALAEPLPPLATFDVTPPEGEAAEAPETAESIRYSLDIEGLDDVDLEGRFRELSALEDGDGEAANGAMVSARAREDEALAVRILRSEGYYDAAAATAIEQVPEEPGRLRVTLTAIPGPRYALGAIAITGPETVPPGLAREALELETGDPIVAAAVEAAEANVALELPQQGYPFVEIGQREVLLDPATQRGDYMLPVEPGPRSLFGGFTTEGELAFDAEHVGVLARFDRGELYDRRKVDDLREAMVATGLFASVAAEPVRTGEPGPDGTEYVNVRVIQQAGPARTLSASAGYNTGEGLRVEGAWEHRNLFPPEGALRFAVVGGTQEQSVSARFRRSNAGKRDRSLTVMAEAAHRNYEAFDAFTATLSGRLARESTPIWQKRWTWAAGVELIATNESRFSFETLERERATYWIGAIPLQLGYDRSDSLLNPTKGFRITGRLSPEVSLQDGTRPYARTMIDASGYFPVSDSLVIAGRARFGSIQGIGRDELAPSRRLYAGGGGSVRGFGYQELGPRDINDDPLGGRSLNEFALEARYRFGNFGIVPFVDAGQVYESTMPQLSNLRFGVGIGGRMYTNFGPLRVDVATPLKRRKGESRIALYISIGQAF
jgi:translocation and assembly module TamA